MRILETLGGVPFILLLCLQAIPERRTGGDIGTIPVSRFCTFSLISDISGTIGIVRSAQ